MMTLKGVLERVTRKPGYAFITNAIGWPIIFYCAVSFFSDGMNRKAMASIIKDTYRGHEAVQRQESSNDNTDWVDDSAEKFQKTFAEPFPENDLGLAYSSLQSISSDKLLENDVNRYISKIMYGTHKEKRWTKKDGKTVETEVDVPDRLSFEELAGKTTVYMDYAHKAARENNVTLNLLVSMMANESGGKNVESNKGAQGPLQIMPATAIDYKLRHDKYVHDSMDPQKNIPTGAEIISKFIKKYDGNVMLALAAYNWGPGRVDRLLDRLQKCPSDVTWSDIKEPLPEETRNYVVKVLGSKAMLDLFNSELDIKWQPLFSENTVAYEVGKGDTFYSVARMFNMHPKTLEKHNKHLPDKNKLLLGEVVYVPSEYVAANR